MRREVKRELEADESCKEPCSKKAKKKPWQYFEAMSFMKDEVERFVIIISILIVYFTIHI
jgi:hypothetical protein